MCAGVFKIPSTISVTSAPLLKSNRSHKNKSPTPRDKASTRRPSSAYNKLKGAGRAGWGGAGAGAAQDFAEASRLSDQCKHIALRAPTVRELLGLALYREARYRDAARELAAYRRLTGADDQNPVMADCYRALKRPERALELCYEIDPASVPEAVAYEGHIVAAGALRDMGRLDDAQRRLEGLELDPPELGEHHLRARYALADLLEQRGRFTQARRLYESIAAVDPEITDAPLRAARLRKQR
jgi:tetratricopeptide (TPR) repeat protein